MEKQKKMALTEEEKSINIVDLFIYLIAHWKWFVLSILLFGGYFWYSYCETPFVYSRTAIVMIKTPANSRSAMQLNNADFIGQVNVASEILQFKSKELMRKVIDRRMRMSVTWCVMACVPENSIRTLLYGLPFWRLGWMSVFFVCYT